EGLIEPMLENLDARRDVSLPRHPVDLDVSLDLTFQEPTSEKSHRARRDGHLQLPSQLEQLILELVDALPKNLTVALVVRLQDRHRRVVDAHGLASRESVAARPLERGTVGALDKK